MRKSGGDSSRATYPAKERRVAAGTQRVLRAGDWYVGGESNWHAELLQIGDVIEFPVYEDDSSNCGNLIARVTCRYREDRFGRAFDATPLACSHADFRGFMEKDLMKKSCRFHVCRSDGSECEWSCAVVHKCARLQYPQVRLGGCLSNNSFKYNTVVAADVEPI